MQNRLILASASPRRKQLLEWAEIQFKIIVEPTDERFPANVTPSMAAKYIAKQKALAVYERIRSDDTILAADTIVVLAQEIIGKPKNRIDAINILSKLQDTTHQVISGVAIKKGDIEQVFSETTEVTFNKLTKDQIEFYIDKYQPYDKAGAYAIQEWIGVVGIKSIKGDFYNVMGLPVNRVVKELANM